MNTNTLAEEENFSKTHSPTSRTELVSLVNQFNENGETYSVVSRGNNWGYGCKNSPSSVKNLIELSFMTRIIDFDSYNGLITIEPGVSYGQLCQFLKEQRGEWIAPVHGGGANCSVVGNVLERGYGITPIMDHFSSCQSLKAILPDGSEYQSAYHSMGLKKLGGLFKYGIGPYLDGIFTQSNLGIVSEMTIKLAAKSEEVEVFFISIENDELAWSIEYLKKIKRELNGTLGGVNLINKERMLSMLIDYPDGSIKSGSPLDKDYIDEMAKKYIIEEWTFVGALYGNKKMVEAAKKIIKKDFKRLKGRKLYFNKRKISFIKFIASKVPKIFGIDLNQVSSSLSELMNILNGIPEQTALKLAYWKNLQEPKNEILDPSKDNCGLIWYAPLVELDSGSVNMYIDFINETAKEFNLNPLITLTTIDDLCFDSTIPILFNKEDPKDIKRAHDFFNVLLVNGKKKGFYPYRLGTNAMDHYHSELNDDYKRILNKFKDSVDEKNLFAEGRYIQKRP